MSYNIQIGIVSGRNPGWRPELVDLSGIADVIASQSPDVVCLQEVDFNRKRSNYIDQTQWLGERLGYHFAFAPAYTSNEPNGTEGAYGNAILSRFPIKEFRVEQLEHGCTSEKWIEPRCCFVATVATDVDVHVVGLHLSTRAPERVQPFEQLREIIQELRGEPLAVMGDFNAELDELETHQMHAEMYNVFGEVQTPTFPNGTAARTMIDHMLVSPRWEVEAAWVVSERLGRSDHNPLVADLRLRS